MFQKVTDISQIEAVEKLAREIWTEHYTPIIGKHQVSYMLDKFQSADAISSQIKKGMEYFLIVEEEIPVGYMGLEFKQNELFLSKIYVLSSMRGKGIGRKAVAFAAEIAKKRNLSRITLTVNKGNISSIKAYEKIGFVNNGSIVSDIGHGFVMDDFRMEKLVSMNKEEFN